MLPIPPAVIPTTMRRALTGALATDPVLVERRRVSRRGAGARPGPDRARVARTQATAPQS